MNNFIHIDLRKPNYLKWKHFLEESDYWNSEKIETYQLSEIKKIIQTAYNKTQGYKNLYQEEGIFLANIQTFDDFVKLPFITKEILRDNLEFFTDNSEKKEYVTTGGSTGIPLGLYRDKNSFSKELASKAHLYKRVGWKEGDRQLVFRGISIDTDDHTIFMPEYNELRCSSYHLTPEWMRIFYEKSLLYKPEWIRCYPSSGYIFAKWLKENNFSIPNLKGVLCASENLYDFQKSLMSEVFGCRIFSHYGHYELAVLAGFCECSDDYHVLPQYGYAELLDTNGNPIISRGEIGEVVATSFIMKATPIIRYKTGDLAVYKDKECPLCHRKHQTWERIEGRLQEFIVSKKGRYISMTAMNFHDDIFDDIKQFQFYQEKKGEVLFKYIPKTTFNQSSLENIIKKIKNKLGEDIILFTTPVENIPLTQRGKHRFLIQKLDNLKYE